MKKIILVEDNRLERKLIQHFLKDNFGQSVTIETANDGQEALELIRNGHFDLVITDLVMPNVEGLELIAKLKQSHPNCPVIAISGSNPYYLTLAKKMGIRYIFTKPLNKEKFLEAVEESIGTKIEY